MTDQSNGEKSTEMPQYIVSNKGQFMLTHNGFKFTKSNQKATTVNWRCSYWKAGRYACHAYASTFYNSNGSECVTYRGSHCHAPNI